VWEQAYKERHGFRPDEICMDGILLSPDWVEIVNGDLRLVEYKCTAKGSSKPLDDSSYWMWQEQAKCYARALNVLSCEFRVLYMAGDRKASFQTERRTWNLEFEPEEIERTWAMVLANKEDKDNEVPTA
jgi:hypothetical protein